MVVMLNLLEELEPFTIFSRSRVGIRDQLHERTHQKGVGEHAYDDCYNSKHAFSCLCGSDVSIPHRRDSCYGEVACRNVEFNIRLILEAISPNPVVLILCFQLERQENPQASQRMHEKEEAADEVEYALDCDTHLEPCLH